ncbi:MAG: hypothetical protein GQ474_06590 [Sulfurimonas sp.]|nr:hypothetical protein [Sulfurimonas sp.]
MIRILFEIIRLTTLSIWSVVGLVFWFPFLFRMLFIFTSYILLSASNGSSLGRAEAGLNRAARFYPDGFSQINLSINNIIKNETAPIVKNEFKSDYLLPLITHLAFALIFWFITLLAVAKAVSQ